VITDGAALHPRYIAETPELRRLGVSPDEAGALLSIPEGLASDAPGREPPRASVGCLAYAPPVSLFLAS
jgi:hypothetical protein